MSSRVQRGMAVEIDPTLVSLMPLELDETELSDTLLLRRVTTC